MKAHPASRGRCHLCLDGLGYGHLDPRGAELLFQILTEREERAFSGVGRTFDDPRLAAAVVRPDHLPRISSRPARSSYRLRITATAKGMCADELIPYRGGQFMMIKAGPNQIIIPTCRWRRAT